MGRLKQFTRTGGEANAVAIRTQELPQEKTRLQYVDTMVGDCIKQFKQNNLKEMLPGLQQTSASQIERFNFNFNYNDINSKK